MAYPLARTLIAASLVLVAPPALHAQSGPPVPLGGTVVISGLTAPGKLLALETGAILVTESGTGAHDGRVTAFDTDGNRLTLVDGLPSGIAPPNNDPSGPSGLALRNHTLYISISSGDSAVAGPVRGTETPNPNPSSPIFSSMLALEFDRGVVGVTAPFRVTPANDEALARHEAVPLVNARGERATLRLVTNIPDHVAEPVPAFPGNVRSSNPYGLEPDGSCAMFMVDASRNVVWKADLCHDGATTVLASFPPLVNPGPVGPPRIDAVPTSARMWNGDLLVSFLTGAPFLAGAADVRRVKTATGEQERVFGGLRTVVDVLPYGGESDGFFVLEFSEDLNVGLPGRVLWFDSPSASPTVFATGLVTPTSLAIDPRTGRLLISQLALGRVVSIPVH